MKFIIEFISLWILWGDYKEAWEDAKLMHSKTDKELQKAIDEINKL